MAVILSILMNHCVFFYITVRQLKTHWTTHFLKSDSPKWYGFLEKPQKWVTLTKEILLQVHLEKHVPVILQYQNNQFQALDESFLLKWLETAIIRMSLQETPNAAANHLKFSKMESKNNQNALTSKLTVEMHRSLNENAPHHQTHIWMLGPELEELFGTD